MRRLSHKYLGTAFVAFVALTATTAAAGVDWTRYDTVGAWGVERSADAGVCRITTKFPNGTVMSFVAQATAKDGGYLYVANDAWVKAFPINSKYPIRVATERRAEDFVGDSFVDGGLMFGLTDNGIAEFMVADQITFAYQSYTLGTYHLRGSYKATVSLAKCLGTLKDAPPVAQGQEPQAPDAPTQGGGGAQDPMAPKDGQSI